jgi:hypothetical protein
MSSNIAEVEESVRVALTPGFRLNLLARGQSRSMIWKDGILPTDAPPFSPILSYDLLSYGYSLLSHALRLFEGGGDVELARKACEHAGEAIEAVVAKGLDRPERDFHRLVAAAAYHLGQFSARAYSLIRIGIEGANLTKCELSIARLMLRDLERLSADAVRERVSQENSDDALVAMLAAAGSSDATGDTSLIEALDRALTDGFMGAIAVALLAFERGEDALMDDATQRLRKGMEGAAEFNLIALWWCHKLAIHMLRGLWEMSFHRCLPLDGAPGESAAEWTSLRSLFIASLYRRKKSEIELWPSQISAAARALEINANLVLSLPTSAGKTRIAELCILACLATGKKIVFVTPLRALSAQTEIGLNRTFSPLGKSVSSLYGSMGVGAADIDALTAKDIVVATPEKLDFAIRNDPSLLDDVGLVILDEGHMIGLNEREVRYEAQIQRLLRRSDAVSRRIVCLSAILPDGDQLNDFVDWLTNDVPGGLIQKNWRPTRLRFGEVVWATDHARLTVTVCSRFFLCNDSFDCRPSEKATNKGISR